VLNLNKTIAYSKSWKATISIATIIGISLGFILVFLQPFDTSESNIPYKNFKLLGYALCVVFPILFFHPIENKIYAKQRNRWFVINEVIYIGIGLIFIITFCYLYNTFIVNSQGEVTKSNWLYFLRYFGLPFAPILGPLWLYFRSRFGKIELPDAVQSSVVLHIKGENKEESLTLPYSNFIYAQAQQNYVLIHYFDEGILKQQIIRSTLSKLMTQIPDAWQVHRSYLVNIDHLKSLEGNARKRIMTFAQPIAQIPVSQKYYEALKYKLANSSQ